MRLIAVGIGLVVGGALGAASATAVYFAIYDPPYHHTQSYRVQGGFMEYYIDGQHVTQQQYDYFLASHSNAVGAVSAAVAVGIAVLLAVLVPLVWWFGRPNKDLHRSLEEQIAALCKEHPDAVQAWGGPGALRERELVDEILRIVEAGRG
jgi:hypothetical protein